MKSNSSSSNYKRKSSETNNSAAKMEIPGYYFDVASNRYFKGVARTLNVEKSADIIDDMSIGKKIGKKGVTIDAKVQKCRNVGMFHSMMQRQFELRPRITNGFNEIDFSIHHSKIKTEFGNFGSGFAMDAKGSVLACAGITQTKTFVRTVIDCSNSLCPASSRSYSSKYGSPSSIKCIDRDRVCETLLGESASGILRIAHLNEVVFSKSFPRKSAWCNSVHPNFSSNGIVSVGLTQTAALVNSLRGGNKNDDVCYLATDNSDVFHQEFVDDGSSLLCASRDGKIRLWDLRSNRCSIVAKCSSSVSWFKQLNSNNNWILSSSMDGSICLWDRRQCKSIQSYIGNKNSQLLLKAAIDPTETYILAGGNDCILRCWNVSSAELVKFIGNFEFPISQIACVSSSNSLLSIFAGFKESCVTNFISF